MFSCEFFKMFKKSFFDRRPPVAASVQVTNDIESRLCQPCIKYRTEVDCHETKKDELIKTQNILKEQTNQLISHIKTFTTNL